MLDGTKYFEKRIFLVFATERKTMCSAKLSVCLGSLFLFPCTAMFHYVTALQTLNVIKA